MKRTEAASAAGAPGSHAMAVYHAVLPRLVRSPALWLFIAVYLLALIIYIPAGGNGYTLLYLLILALYYLLVAFLVFPLTMGAPSAAWEEETDTSRAGLWIQLAVIALFLARRSRP